MMKFTKFTAVAMLFSMLIAGFGASSQADKNHGDHASMMVADAWARARGATAKIAGAFMILHNASKEDDRLVSASSPISARVEIHTTKMTDGVMKMIQLKQGVSIPAGEHVMLKPGGFHVMFLGLKEKLAEGTTFPVTLSFEKAGKIDVIVAVKSVGAMGHMKHGEMKHDEMKHEHMKHGEMKHEHMKKQ